MGCERRDVSSRVLPFAILPKIMKIFAAHYKRSESKKIQNCWLSTKYENRRDTKKCCLGSNNSIPKQWAVGMQLKRPLTAH